jgi:hypothetical protein
MSYGRTLASAVFWVTLSLALLSEPLAGQCVDYSKDPAGCQPSTFDTPIGQMPSVRVNRAGKLDPASSEEDARAGVAALEKELHLFRNIEPIHWVLTVPSVKDPATGAWKGGDLDAAGDGRGLGIAGSCIFVGHGNGAGRSMPSTFSRFNRIRKNSRPCKSVKSPPCSRAIKDSMIASCARWFTKRPKAKTATFWFATPELIPSAEWKPTEST